METLTELIASLRSVRYFAKMAEHDLQTVITSGQVRRFRTGEAIFHEGFACDGMFVLIRGQIHLCKIGPQGQENILAVINPVVMFNEVAAIDGGVNLATAIAVQDCLLWQIGSEALQTLLIRYPQMSLGMLRVLAARNRKLVERYEDLSFRSVLARTAKLLLDLSQNGQVIIHRQEHPIHKLAGQISSVPEAISRTLNTFKGQGVITCTRAEISVIQPLELAKLAETNALLDE